MDMNNSNLLWFFAFLFLMGGGNGFFGNRGMVPMGPPPASQQDVNEAVNNQSIQQSLNALGIATSNNNYETAKMFQDQNLLMQSQNNTTLINMIQGFNSLVQQTQAQTAQIVQQAQAQTAQLSSKLDQLGFKMETCCCDIKTQLLQQQLAEANAKIVQQQGEISNQVQTQNILDRLGRWVAWTGTGSQGSTPATA